MHFTRSDTTAEEIVQEIFLKLWLQRESLEQIGNFGAYLYIITRNLCFDHLKKLAREQVMKKNFSQMAASVENEVESRVIRNNYELLLNRALEELPSQQRKIYQLSFQYDHKHDEIARQLNISKNTVKAHLAKARAAVRNYFEGYVDFIVLLCLVPYSFL